MVSSTSNLLFLFPFVYICNLNHVAEVSYLFVFYLNCLQKYPLIRKTLPLYFLDTIENIFYWILDFTTKEH